MDKTKDVLFQKLKSKDNFPLVIYLLTVYQKRELTEIIRSYH